MKGGIHMSADRVDQPAEPEPEQPRLRPVPEGPLGKPRDPTLATKFGRFLMDGTPYLSPSQVARVLTCPARYDYKYLQGRDEPESVNLILGQCIHQTLEDALKNLRVGQTWAVEHVADQAGRLAFAVFTDTSITQRVRDEPVDPVALAFQAKQLALLAWKWILDEKLAPLLMEEAVVNRVSVDGVDIATLGYPDLVARTPTGRVAVIDFKTAAKSPSKDANEQYVMTREHAFASLTYAHGLGKTPGHKNPDTARAIPDEIWTVYLVKNKEPVLRVAKLPVQEHMLTWAMGVTQTAARTLLSGNLMPNPFGAGFFCSQKYCAFYNICPGSAGKVGGGE